MTEPGSGGEAGPDTPHGGFPATRNWREGRNATTEGGPEYGRMIDSLREFLDLVAGAKLDSAAAAALAGQIEALLPHLASRQVREREQIFAHRIDLPGRGQTMAPRFLVTDGDDTSVAGRVTFGRYFLGGNGAVHGGAIPLLFDEVLGRLANTGGRKPSRTAYLHVNFRSIAPIGRDLDVRARIVKIDGRKRFITAELCDGDTLCADAEGLFVELKPGQP